VVPPETERWAREVACKLTPLCPGWNVAYQARTGLWIAQKQGGPWLLDASTEPWSLVVTAADFLELYIRLNLKALTELAAEFGDLHVACEPGTSIWSATGPASPGEPTGPTFRAPTPLQLVHQVRCHLVSIGAGDTEPWFRLLDDPVTGNEPTVVDATLDDVIDEVGDGWDCREITGGFAGVPRGQDGTAIPRVERTPALLLARIRAVEGRS